MLVRLWIGIWNGSVTIWLSIWRILWIRHIWDWSLLWRGDRYGGYGTISLLSLIGGMRIIFLSWLNLRRLPTFLLQLAIKQIGRIEARSFNWLLSRPVCPMLLITWLLNLLAVRKCSLLISRGSRERQAGYVLILLLISGC